MRDGKRRCDSVCHNAHGAKCGCICGGKFHGANVVRAKSSERGEIEEVVLTRAVETEKAKKNNEAINHLIEVAVQPRLAFDEPEDLDAMHERAEFHLKVAALQEVN